MCEANQCIFYRHHERPQAIIVTNHFLLAYLVLPGVLVVLNKTFFSNCCQGQTTSASCQLFVYLSQWSTRIYARFNSVAGVFNFSCMWWFLFRRNRFRNETTIHLYKHVRSSEQTGMLFHRPLSGDVDQWLLCCSIGGINILVKV